jgi:hypothetical protein
VFLDSGFMFRTSARDLSHWRKRLGDKLELLLAESLRVAHESGALRTRDLTRVSVDTIVQPKAISFPTDVKLLHAAIKGLTGLAANMGCGCGEHTYACGSAWAPACSAPVGSASTCRRSARNPCAAPRACLPAPPSSDRGAAHTESRILEISTSGLMRIYF